MSKSILLALLIATCAVSTYGQDEGQARDLYRVYANNRAQGKPGAKIRVELLRNGQRQFVPLDTAFRSGDKIKLHFEVNFPAYVEIFNLGSSGDRARLFPMPGVDTRAKVTAGVVPPQPAQWFEFDERPGTERLTFIFSSAPLRPAGQGSANKRPATKPTKTVRPGGQASADEAQQSLQEFDARAQNEKISRDLNRMQVEAEHYVLTTEQRIRVPVKFIIELQHR